MFWSLHRTNQPEEHDKEQSLLNELSPESQHYYALQTRQLIATNFTDPHETTTTPAELKDYKLVHPPKELPYVNCADVQAAFMECMQSGPWKERWTGCDSWSKKVQRCLKMQTALFVKLRLEHATSLETYKEIASAADSLSVKWLDDYGEDGKMSDAMLVDIYDKRDAIWAKK